MIDLCKIFGVEEGEDFKLDSRNEVYKVINNKIYRSDFFGVELIESCLSLNETTETKVIKLPKKKEFTDDELAIMRSLPKLYEWIARDGSGRMFMYNVKPKRSDSYWEAQNTLWNSVVMFEHIFNSITWEDEEPVYIDDYVERGGE